MNTKRYCMIIELKEEFVDDYVKIHRDPWPELLAMEKSVGIKEELIWIYKNLAILYYECDDINRVHKILSNNEIEKRWYITVCPWFKDSTVLNSSRGVKTLNKVFDLSQQLAGKLEPF